MAARDGEVEFTETGFLEHSYISERKFITLTSQTNNTFLFRSTPYDAISSDDRANTTWIDVFYLNFKSSTNKFPRIEQKNRIDADEIDRKIGFNLQMVNIRQVNG